MSVQKLYNTANQNNIVINSYCNKGDLHYILSIGFCHNNAINKSISIGLYCITANILETVI